jgi:methionyl-tRNA formyltransferase
VLAPERLRTPVALAAIEALGPDVLVLADYGQIVPRALLDLPPRGALNLHPSLLPRHRGAAPVPAAILAGDAVTGVSLMRMDAGVDTGPVIAQVEVPLAGDEDAPGLETRLAGVAAALLLDRLPGWLGGTLVAEPQPTEGATLTRPLRREDGRLDATIPAVSLERQVRALRPWPGTYLDRPEGRLIVHEARVVADAVPAGSRPGDLVAVTEAGRHEVALVTADGLLRLDVVQPAGKTRMSGAELVRGRPGWLVGRA